jgi:cyclohexyl-isocyanide hydratase
MTEEFIVVFPLFQRVTQLDFTGPYEVFSRLPGARCVLASVEGKPIQGDGGITFSNVVRLSELDQCSLLCVPGGFGTIATMEDTQYLAQLRRLAMQAKYVTSVCTGSLLLAAAGLLRGKRAACHWAWRDLLSEFEVVPDPARIVRDGNVISGGGVTAGIDMALSVIADIAGSQVAQAVQLGIEYAPEPPFDCGCPERASPEVVAAVRKRTDAMSPERRAVAQRAAQLDFGRV